MGRKERSSQMTLVGGGGINQGGGKVRVRRQREGT